MLRLLRRILPPFTFFLLLAMIPAPIMAQRIVDKNKGDHFQTKKGIMDGNLAQTVYYNFGEVADWLNVPTLSGVWPKGTNHTYIDGVAVIVQAEVTTPAGKKVHPLETNYYEYTRHDPATGVTYGWWPLPGYFNPFQSSPTQSNTPNTWPKHWPDRPPDWDGYWNGFFGKGVQNADLETYFVFDDHEDREYILDISYAWSTVPYGNPGNWSPVGYSGYAFLESPGIADDRRDNDDDGLTDEHRDNAARNFVNDPSRDPSLVDVSQDTNAFRKFYGYSWRPHWDADENANWQGFSDFNKNGKWDEDEPLNDDVGADGIGPFDEGYTGADRDGSEGNAKPDQGQRPVHQQRLSGG